MKINVVRAGTGAKWVVLGFKTFFRKPFQLLVTFLVFMLLVSPLATLPFPASLLAHTFSPLLLLLIMIASTQAMSGRSPWPFAVLSVVLRDSPQQKKALLMLGLLYAGGYIACVLPSFALDGGIVAKQMLGLLTLPWEEPEQVEAALRAWIDQAGGRGWYMASSMTVLLCLSLLAACFWHAPALVQWYGMKATTAVYFSLMACLRNWRAFGVYILAWAAALFAAVLALSLVGAMLLLTGSAAASAILNTLMFGAVLSISMASVTSLVFTFRDCFPPPAEQQRPDDATAD